MLLCSAADYIDVKVHGAFATLIDVAGEIALVDIRLVG